MLSGCTRRTAPEFVHHIHHRICSFLLCPCNSNCHSSWIQVTGETLKRVEKRCYVFLYDSIRLWQKHLIIFPPILLSPCYFSILCHFCVPTMISSQNASKIPEFLQRYQYECVEQILFSSWNILLWYFLSTGRDGKRERFQHSLTLSLCRWGTSWVWEDI